MGSILKEYKLYQLKLEEKYGNDCIVLLMVGSFYEIYGLNTEECSFGKVEKVSKILNILMTRKDKSKKHSISNPYLCGFPVHSIGKHLHKLLSHKFTVAIYDQFDIENSKKKMRKLVHIYSPSTYIDSEILENNDLMAIYIESYYCPLQKALIKSCYISSIDLSTGKNRVFTCSDTRENPNKVEEEIIRIVYMINPCEILIDGDDNIKTNLEGRLVHSKKINKKFFNIDYQNNFIQKVFEKDPYMSPIESINLEKYNDLCACYLFLLQFAYEHDSRIIKRIQKPEFVDSSANIIINNDALLQLNLLNNNDIKSKYKSLLNVIDCAYTRMGKRLLKSRLLSPIFNEDILNERYNLVESFIKDGKYLEYQKYLKGIGDIEKKYRKLVLQRLHPYEFARLNDSFENIIELLKLSNKNIILKDFKEFYIDYKITFDIDIMEKYNLGNIKKSFFNKNINNKLDNIHKKSQKIINILKDFAAQLSQIIDKDFQNLIKLDYNDKEGFFLTTTKKRWEILNKNSDFIIKINDKFIEKNDLIVKKLTNYIRLSHPILDNYWVKFSKFRKNIKILVKHDYLAKLKQYDQKYNKLFRKLIDFISETDVYCSSAKVAVKFSYVKPEISPNDRSFFNIENIRHPLIERLHDDKEYITNNISLDNTNCGILLYGINAGGKSSLLRAIGTNIILAQMGMYVSASKFNYKPFKHLLTKIGSNDDIFKGQSTFVVEMLELKNILKISDKNSLILCDELTAGTETSSATGIVASTLSALLKKEVNFVFTTHLHGLMNFPEITENKFLEIYHFKILVKMDKINYQYKLEKGSGDSTYGIEIAKVIGLDKDFIKDAFYFRNKFNNRSINFIENKRSKYNSKIIVDQCQNCGAKDRLHTHHIIEQCKANKNGIIKHFPKNIKHNLKILCENCHRNVHKSIHI